MLAKVNRQGKDRAQLNDDGIHLPVATRQRNMQQRLGDSQMSGGTDRQEFRESFNDTQQNRKKIIAQAASGYAESVLQKKCCRRVGTLIQARSEEFLFRVFQREKTTPCGLPEPFHPCGQLRSLKLNPTFPSASWNASSMVSAPVDWSNFSR